MLEFRKDPVIGRWVIISTERRQRPIDQEIHTVPSQGSFCPFCPGNETFTPDPILVLNDTTDDPSSWRLRVVPNKFPALEIEGRIRRRADGIFDKMSGIGAHEVIIETPDHNADLATMPIGEIRQIFETYRERILDLEKDQRLKYIMVFKNHGVTAGASLSHPHSQLIAMPIVPKRVSEELAGANAYYEYKERCVFCDILEQELEDGIRIIESNGDFVALAPYAPRFPFETWILPRDHQCHFEKTPAYQPLAELISSVMKRLNAVLGDPPYNYLIHSAPFRHPFPESYHWHIELIPILTRVAGFEWGTGFHINPTPPEEAAEFLRNADI